MSTWQTIYGSSVDGDPVRAHPAPFDTESTQASTTAQNVEYVSDEFHKIQFGDSSGFRGETAEALGRKVAGWQAKLDPTAGVFRDLSKIMSSHSDQLTSLRSQAEQSAAKALAIWKLKVAAQESADTTAQSIPGASGDVSAAKSKLAWIHTQIAALTPGTPDTAILLPKYQNEQATWTSELSTSTARLNSLSSTLKSAQGQVGNYQSQLNDWHYGGRDDSWQSLRRREDDLNSSTAQRIKNIDLGSLANPGFLAQKEADFASFIRDTVAAIDKAVTAAIKTLIAAIKIVLIVVAVIVLAIVAIAVIVAAIYLIAVALVYVVELLALVARLTAPLWVPALAKALLRRAEAQRLYRYNRDVLHERPVVRPTKSGSQARALTDRIAAANGDPNALKSPKDREYLELARGAYGKQLPQWMTDAGWIVMPDDWLRSAGLLPPPLNDPKSGFQAQVYYNRATGEVVLAFAGTQDATDAATDAEDAMSPLVNVAGSQYNRAVEVARLLEAKFPGQVVMTGHSLGGDLAAVAAFATGDSPAVTFNAKGTNLQDLETMPNAPWSPPEIQQYAASHIITYGTPDNILGTVQDDSPAPDAIGNFVGLPPSHSATTWWNPFDGHMIDALRQSMEEDPITGQPVPDQPLPEVTTGTF